MMISGVTTDHVVLPIAVDSLGRLMTSGGSVAETDPVFSAWLAAGTIQLASAEADSNISKGMPVYVKNTGHIEKAQADASGTSTVSGLMIQDVLSGFSGKFAKDGSITLADWTAITGFVTLSAGQTYYLSPSVVGMLTSTAPTTVGQYVVKVGIALSTTTMAIEIEPKILL